MEMLISGKLRSLPDAHGLMPATVRHICATRRCHDDCGERFVDQTKSDSLPKKGFAALDCWTFRPATAPPGSGCGQKVPPFWLTVSLGKFARPKSESRAVLRGAPVRGPNDTHGFTLAAFRAYLIGGNHPATG